MPMFTPNHAAVCPAIDLHNPTILLTIPQGIPYELRACQWHHMSGAAAHQAAAGPGYYASLAQIKALSVNSLLTLNEELSPGTAPVILVTSVVLTGGLVLRCRVMIAIHQL